MIVKFISCLNRVFLVELFNLIVAQTFVLVRESIEDNEHHGHDAHNEDQTEELLGEGLALVLGFDCLRLEARVELDFCGAESDQRFYFWLYLCDFYLVVFLFIFIFYSFLT